MQKVVKVLTYELYQNIYYTLIIMNVLVIIVNKWSNGEMVECSLIIEMCVIILYYLVNSTIIFYYFVGAIDTINIFLSICLSLFNFWLILAIMAIVNKPNPFPKSIPRLQLWNNKKIQHLNHQQMIQVIY